MSRCFVYRFLNSNIKAAAEAMVNTIAMSNAETRTTASVSSRCSSLLLESDFDHHSLGILRRVDLLKTKNQHPTAIKIMRTSTAIKASLFHCPRSIYYSPFTIHFLQNIFNQWVTRTTAGAGLARAGDCRDRIKLFSLNLVFYRPF